MKNLKKNRRIQVLLLAFLALASATLLIGYGFRDGINLFRTPTQLLADHPSESETFRIGGLVKEGSLKRGEGSAITFLVTDNENQVPVRYTGILPDLFGEGEGMIGTGHLEGDVFVASEILAKHDEKYMPKEVIDSLKANGTYVDPNAAAATN
ncbi:MAG: cytochrome c maturation protein CcmE [Rhodobacteraceae bacterium]|nr:cytochrome c maturation protein CcmE [Paracoccaceae bacterium]